MYITNCYIIGVKHGYCTPAAKGGNPKISYIVVFVADYEPLGCNEI